jgi:GT2 family glycosyltransferase
MADKFFVTAVLVTHDGATWLPEVIAALSSQTRPIDRIIAVDTGSRDKSLKLLKSSGFTAFVEDREMGYGDAIEHALALTPSSGDNEWLWLIHDDCAPDKDALQNLLDAIEERPQVALAGPKLRGWSDRSQLLEVGISISGNGSRWTGLEPSEKDQGQHDSILEVMSVSTAAMLVRRSVFEELGGLDINLALFRDDVDFGWRAHVAGYQAICVPDALAYHVEASANEMRAVDVSEAFLHRPLLLDRRNAAYVLLVNSSWWLLPWIALQLFLTSAARAIINLLAKLPGYAGDELAAVGLLLLNPAELIRARRDRKRKRLLSPRVVSHFIPSSWSQIQLAFERTGSALLRAVSQDHSEDEVPTASYSDIGTIEENFEDADLTPVKSSSFWPSLIKKPQFIIAFVIAIISLVASRGRYGSLAGGALALAPESGLTALRHYADSWHLVGMGSAAPMPPWLPILGISSVLTLGNLRLLLMVIFLLAPALCYLTIYRVLLRQEVDRNYALVGAGIYVASPLLWATINEGRIGTLLVLQLAPTLLSLSPFARKAERFSWRRTFAISLLAGVIGAFSPILLGIWIISHLVLLSVVIWGKRAAIRELGALPFLFSDHLDGAKRRLALALTPWLLTFPWSASLIIHPTQLLLEPGIPIPSGSQWGTLLFNPGGVSAPPMWIISPLLLLLALTLIVQRLRNIGLIASLTMGMALTIGQLVISGHGSKEQVWSGPLVAIAMAILLAPSLKFAQDQLPVLAERRLGWRHTGWSLVALSVAFNLIAIPVWAVTGGANSLVSSRNPSHVPAFITALEQTSSRPKTIILRATQGETTYFVTRGSELLLGDADVAIAIPDAIGVAMNQLANGSGLTSSRILGHYGIQYLYLENPAPVSLVREIDGIGGFTRMSATNDGIAWRVVGSNPRILFTTPTGVRSGIASHDVSAVADLPSGGVLSLAEKYDRNWRVLLDGRPIPLQQSSSGLPVFTIPQAGQITLSYDGTLHRALLSIQLITLIFAIVMALPAGRRRRDLRSATLDESEVEE